MSAVAAVEAHTPKPIDALSFEARYKLALEHLTGLLDKVLQIYDEQPLSAEAHEAAVTEFWRAFVLRGGWEAGGQAKDEAIGEAVDPMGSLRPGQMTYFEAKIHQYRAAELLSLARVFDWDTILGQVLLVGGAFNAAEKHLEMLSRTKIADLVLATSLTGIRRFLEKQLRTYLERHPEFTAEMESYLDLVMYFVLEELRFESMPEDLLEADDRVSRIKLVMDAILELEGNGKRNLLKQFWLSEATRLYVATGQTEYDKLLELHISGETSDSNNI